MSKYEVLENHEDLNIKEIDFFKFLNTVKAPDTKDKKYYAKLFFRDTDFLKEVDNFFKSVFTYYDVGNLILEVSKEKGDGEKIVINGDSAKFGRKSNNDFVLKHSGISGEHFILFRGAGGWEVVSLQTVNGTYLNGRKLHPKVKTLLKNGDVIQVPGYKLRVVLENVKKIDVGARFNPLNFIEGIGENGIFYDLGLRKNSELKFTLGIPYALCKKIIGFLTGYNFSDEELFLELSEVEKGIMDYFIYNVIRIFNKYLEGYNGNSLFVINSYDELVHEKLKTLPVEINFSKKLKDVFYFYLKEDLLKEIFERDELEENSIKLMACLDLPIAKNISFKASFSLFCVDMNLSELSILEEEDIILGTFEIGEDEPLFFFKDKKIDVFFYPSRVKGNFILSDLNEKSISFSFKNFNVLERNMTEKVEKNNEKKVSKESENVDKEVLKEVSEIPMNLRIEIGRIDIKLNDLLSLHEGSVITIDREIDDIVNLVLNGEIIGKGKLVNIEGRLGVKVLEIKK